MTEGRRSEAQPPPHARVGRPAARTLPVQQSLLAGELAKCTKLTLSTNESPRFPQGTLRKWLPAKAAKAGGLLKLSRFTDDFLRMDFFSLVEDF